MTTRISGINIYTFLPTDPCLAASCLRALEMESEFLQAAHLADVSWSSYCFFHGVNVFFVRSLLTQQLFAERCWRHPLPPFPTNYHPPPPHKLSSLSSALLFIPQVFSVIIIVKLFTQLNHLLLILLAFPVSCFISPVHFSP